MKEESAGKKQRTKESRESFSLKENFPKIAKDSYKFSESRVLCPISGIKWKKNSFLVYISDRKSDSYTGEKAQDVPFP
ncbi:hypothetical protein [Leptospira barantonii]|uniref:hypothetical protein n=1 Tax=Leptospira barantonii TaxID=2023184 RepID=UPI0014382D22|nr:hypothetical protein [Leptospira barantonii]